MENENRASAKRINLKGLAEQLSLSKTTVSRALNGFPEVSETTRTRVNEAAERLGYFPNKSAARLASGKVGAIGLIIPIDTESFMDPIRAEFIDGVGRELAKSGTDLVVQPVTARDPISAYKRAIAQNTVDGFIVSGPTLVDPRVDFLATSGFPFVLHGRTNGAAEHSYFDIDNDGGFYKATQYLISQGHQRIAIVGGIEGHTFTHDRLTGTRRALKEVGLVLMEEDIHMGPMNEQTGYDVAQSYFKPTEQSRPTAFLCLSLFVALGLTRGAREHGAEVPEDLSIIVHDDRAPYLRAELFDPPLTALQSSIRNAGEGVTRMLLQEIDSPRAKATKVIEPVELHVRNSVKRL